MELVILNSWGTFQQNVLAFKGERNYSTIAQGQRDECYSTVTVEHTSNYKLKN